MRVQGRLEVDEIQGGQGELIDRLIEILDEDDEWYAPAGFHPSPASRVWMLS